jgi:chromosome segregation ATPase
MIQASKTIEVLRQRIDSFEKRDQRHFTEISGLETSLSVAQSQLERVQSEYAGFRAQSAERAERLAYLEGYYAKSTEPIATRLIE